MAVFVEWTFEGSLKRNIQQGEPGTKPVINEERMLVRVKWTIRQFEWYRDNKEFYYRLKHNQLEAVFVL